jgi:hypothetical protein
MYQDLVKYKLLESDFINQTINSDVMPEKMFKNKQNKYHSFLNSLNNQIEEHKFNEEFCTFQDTFTLQKNTSFEEVNIQDISIDEDLQKLENDQYIYKESFTFA